MPRLLFKTGEQKDYLLKAKNKLSRKTAFLAKLCGVHERTVGDWLQEKYFISQSAAQKISERLKIKTPEIIKTLPDFWSISKAGKIGAVARYKIYGNPGTKDGRSKGGKKSCRIQQEALKKGVVTGFVVRKNVLLPAHSEDLAEAVGIILGDGHISRFQVFTHSSAIVDKEYADYIDKLFRRLFNVDVVRLKVRKNTISQVISGREIVEFLARMGLKGLFDTDGSIYYHRHVTRGREYNDIGWEFGNLNTNLLQEFQKFLLKKGFNSKIKETSVAIYNRFDIHQYFKEIGGSNPKHLMRYLQYFQGVGRGVRAGRRSMPGKHVYG